MYIFGLVILVCVGLYCLFLAVDRVALADQKGTARIVSKEHREAGKTYNMEIIGGRPQVVPQAAPERYILKLGLGGRETEGTVTKSRYEAVHIQDPVHMTYQQRRITAALQVVDVHR